MSAAPRRFGAGGSDRKEEVESVATKSILKTIHVGNRRPAAALIRALENAKGKAAKEVVMSRGYSEASREDIAKMFGAEG